MTEAPPASASSSFLDTMNSVVDGLSKSEGAITPPVPQAETQQSDATQQTPQTEEPKTETKQSKKGLDALLDDSGEEPADQQQPEKTEDAEDIPENIKDNPKAVAKWGEIKAEKKALERELQQLKAQLTEKSKLQDADPLRKEAEEYKRKYEELEKEAATWRIEKTSAYENEVTKPLLQIENEVTEIANRHDIEADKVLAAFNEPDPKVREKMLEDIAEFMPQSSRYKLFALNDRCIDAFKKAGELHQNAQAAMQELTAREQVLREQSKAESKAQEIRAIESNLEKLKKVASNFVLDDQSPEKFIDELKAEASETSFDELSPEDKAFAVIASTSLPKINKVITALRKEIKSLRSEISGYGSAMPRASGGQASQGGRNNAEASFLEAVGVA